MYKAIVDLRSTPSAKVSGPMMTSVNKNKTIIGPNQKAVLTLRSPGRYLERIIVNKTNEPIVARTYWSASSSTFQAKEKAQLMFQSVSGSTLVTPENLQALQAEGIYALRQDKPTASVNE